jgi:hypothetical protein
MNRRRLASLMAASALIIGMFGLSAGSVAATVDYATVTGHQASTAENNDPDFWGEDCEKLAISGVDSYVLEASYDLVVVKAGSSSGDDPNSLTLFGDSPSAGQTVWADTNGDGVFNVGGPGGDHQISHIIVCGPAETTTTTTEETTTEETTTEETTTEETTTEETTTEETTTEETTTTTTFTGGTGGETDAPTQPNTAVETGGPSTPSNSAWMLILALGLLLGSVVILTPAKAKAKR